MSFIPEAFAFPIDNSLFPPASYGTFGSLASVIVKFLISLSGTTSIIFIIIGGIKIVTASGDEKKLASAQSTILYAIIGLVVTILALVMVNIVQKFFGSNVQIY